MLKIIPLSAATDLLSASALWFFGYRLHKFNTQNPAASFTLFFEKMLLFAAAGLTFYGLGFWAFAKNPWGMGIVNVIGEIPLNLGLTFLVATWMNLQFPRISSSKIIKLGIVVTCTQAILHLRYMQFPIILPPYGIRDFNAHPIPGTFMALYNAIALIPTIIIFGIRSIKGKTRTVRIRSAFLSFGGANLTTAGILDGVTQDLFFKILSPILHIIGATILFMGLLYRQKITEGQQEETKI